MHYCRNHNVRCKLNLVEVSYSIIKTFKLTAIGGALAESAKYLIISDQKFVTKNIQTMHKKIPFFMIVLFIGHLIKAQQQDLLKYVNTLQGTNSNEAFSYGNTYPAIALPFPVHSFSPQTGKNGDRLHRVT